MNPFLVLYLVMLIAIVAAAVYTFFIVGWKVFLSVMLATAAATALLVFLENQL